jgi:hypothetical protein
MKPDYQSHEFALANWYEGGKRISNYTGEVFATRKDRRMNDRQFLKPRMQARRKNWRTGRLMRRAKPIGVNYEESKAM